MVVERQRLVLKCIFLVYSGLSANILLTFSSSLHLFIHVGICLPEVSTEWNT